MSFYIQNISGGDVVLDDLGLTIPASTGGSPEPGIYDLTAEDSRQVAQSDDLVAQITAGNLVVLDPLDGVTQLSVADGVESVRVANDPHFRIRGGTLNQLDDVSITGSPVDLTNKVLQWNNVDAFTPVTPDTIVGDAIDTINQSVVALLTDGVATTVTTTGSPVTSVQIDVDDVFLHNTGDTLDSGTLTIASGATVSFSTGSSLVIADGATATIETPTGNFTSPNQLINKAYVDSVAAGFDPKESVRAATTAPLDATPVSGSPAGFGTTLTITGSPIDSLVLDGVTLQDGDRVLVKDGIVGSPVQYQWNGIYVVSGVGSQVVLTRAEDQDGTPNVEVSGGNFTFVEEGTTYADTGWVVYSPNGTADVDVDPLLWTQFSGPGTYTFDIGLATSGTTIALDLSTTHLADATPALNDRIAFHDVTGAAQSPTGTQTYGATFTETYNAHDVVYGVSSDGFVVRTADDVYASRTITAAGLGALDGIDITNGDGVSGDPVVGLDIQNLPAGSGSPIVDLLGRIPVYDTNLGANVYYTVSEISSAQATTNSFTTWAGSGSGTTGGPNVASSGSDTMTLDGGTGISIVLTAGSDTIQWNLDFGQIPATGSPGAIDTTDEIIINNGGTIVKSTIGDVLEQLDIVNGVTGTGIIVKTSSDPDAYTSRAIEVDGPGNFDGLSVTNGDGISGNPTLGLDIVGTPAKGSDMEPTDEFIVHNTTGSPNANVKITGQEVANGVFSSLGVSIQPIGNSGSPGEMTLFLTDSARGKDLSINEFTLTWSESTIGNNDWVEIGNAVDADVGFIIPMDATLVRATAFTVSAPSDKDIVLYLDAASSGTILTLAAGSLSEVSDITLNIDVAAGQRVRLRGGATGGTVGDATIVLWFKWRT